MASLNFENVGSIVRLSCSMRRELPSRDRYSISYDAGIPCPSYMPARFLGHGQNLDHTDHSVVRSASLTRTPASRLAQHNICQDKSASGTQRSRSPTYPGPGVLARALVCNIREPSHIRQILSQPYNTAPSRESELLGGR